MERFVTTKPADLFDLVALFFVVFVGLNNNGRLGIVSIE
jgi:hypothetical protein